VPKFLGSHWGTVRPPALFWDVMLFGYRYLITAPRNLLFPSFMAEEVMGRDGASRFLRNAGRYIPDYVASRPRRQ
jgi:hypothetical protein